MINSTKRCRRRRRVDVRRRVCRGLDVVRLSLTGCGIRVMMQQNEIWGVRAGANGQADDLFLKQNYVALGWPLVGDLAAIKPNRNAFKVKVAACYGGGKPGAIPVWAGVLFRFL